VGVIGEPKTLTIEEAAAELRIGRTLAYEQARAFGSLAGVPVLRIGRRYVVSRAGLARVLGGGDPPPNVTASGVEATR